MGIPIAGSGSEMNELFGPECSSYHTWLKRIKNLLDPNSASNPFFYVRGGKAGSEN
jgi:hypothetical protein